MKVSRSVVGDIFEVVDELELVESEGRILVRREDNALFCLMVANYGIYMLVYCTCLASDLFVVSSMICKQAILR